MDITALFIILPLIVVGFSDIFHIKIIRKGFGVKRFHIMHPTKDLTVVNLYGTAVIIG